MAAADRDESALARVEGRFDALLVELAGATTPVPGGLALRTEELPLVWSLNQVRIREPLELGQLLDIVEEHQAHQPYRHVNVRPGALDPASEEVLRAAGWRIEHEVVMVLRSRVPDGADARVTELSEDQALELMARWLQEERGDTTEEGLDQVLEYNRREGRRFDERRLGVLDESGQPASVTKLRVDEGLAWVEDVYTVPSARRRGHARVLVGHAVDLALAGGCELVTIVADADDWPQHLYARIGFRPIGLAATFHLDVA